MKRLCVNLPKKTTLPCVIIDLAVLGPHISCSGTAVRALINVLPTTSDYEHYRCPNF